MGDAAGTGQFDIAQLVILARLLTGESASLLQQMAADLNGSGEPDIADLVILAGYIRERRPPAPAVPYPELTPSRSIAAFCSATGTTKRIAQMAAAAADADLFEPEPVESYTAADLRYTDPDSSVPWEHGDPALRDVPLVAAFVEDFAAYDTAYIGFRSDGALPPGR